MSTQYANTVNTATSNNPQFTWIKFYEELADKLLEYKNERKRDKLRELVYSLDREWINHLYKNNRKLSDIDPFTIFAIFNRQIKDTTKIAIAERLKELFNIETPVPQDFYGIPRTHNKLSIFFKRERTKKDVPPLWELFRAALKHLKTFNRCFDTVINQEGIRWNVTTLLYWIRPNDYMTLDTNSRKYLKANDIDVFSVRNLSGKYYQELLDTIRNSEQFQDKDFPEISATAWDKNQNSENQETEQENDSEEDDDVEDVDYQQTDIIDKAVKLLQLKKNIILQGAPGTGKTYSTAEIALKLIGVNEDVFNNHETVMKKYNELKDNKQIFFTTFHQSMDYEDFVEGLKPDVKYDDNGNPIGVIYKTTDGIFKLVCQYAEENPIVNIEETDFTIDDDTTVWKVALDSKVENERNGQYIRTYCFENNCIRIGWGHYGNVDFSDFINSDEKHDGESSLYAFQKEMKKGDIVLINYGRDIFDAIGVITGDYKYVETDDNFSRFRKVKWLVKGIKRDIKPLNNNNDFAINTVSRVPNIQRDKLEALIQELQENKNSTKCSNEQEKPVVLIIDEINRGNISKIFGELITLLEADKRTKLLDTNKQADKAHPITVTLPYSQKDFSVPSNVYIIGTMNTTDRSTGTLDYAVRRRFAFVTLPANPEVIPTEAGQIMFEDVKSFIEDEEHRAEDIDLDDLMVGQSYFMADNKKDLQLQMEYEVIPLIKEYIHDGILTVDNEEMNECFECWCNLETYYENDDDSDEDFDEEDFDEDEDEDFDDDDDEEDEDDDKE